MEGFEIAEDERVLFSLRPGVADYFSAALMGFMLGVAVVVAGGGVTAGVLLIAAVIGLSATGMASVLLQAPSRLLVTDVGLRLREGDREELLPWSQVVSISPTTPGIAQWKVTLRSVEGGVAAEDQETRTIGSFALWDPLSRRREAIRGLMDQWAVAAIQEVARLDSGDQALGLKAVDPRTEGQEGQ